VSIIKGYKKEGCDLQSVEEALNSIQEVVSRQSNRIYAKLLAKEIENYVDDIALNVLPANNEHSIYEHCVAELNRQINWAITNGTITAYNLASQVAVYTYMGDTYFKLNIQNHLIESAIKTIPGISEFDLTDSEGKAAKKRQDVWTEIMKIYESNSPLVKQLYPVAPIEVKWSAISGHFNTRENRLEQRIRHALTSELLNLIGMKQEIPNYKLLGCLDEALMMLDQPKIKAEANNRYNRCISAMVNITEEMVKRSPKAEINHTFAETALANKSADNSGDESLI